MAAPETAFSELRAIHTWLKPIDFGKIFQERRDGGSINPEPDDNLPVVMRTADLIAGYGKSTAVEDINLTIYKNRVTALMGPSGSGKSTIVRCMNRIHEMGESKPWQNGAVYFEDQNIYDSAVNPVLLRRRIGMVFQRAWPFPTLSIAENVVAGIEMGVDQPKMNKADLAFVTEKYLSLDGRVSDRVPRL